MGSGIQRMENASSTICSTSGSNVNACWVSPLVDIDGVAATNVPVGVLLAFVVAPPITYDDAIGQLCAERTWSVVSPSGAKATRQIADTEMAHHTVACEHVQIKNKYVFCKPLLLMHAVTQPLQSAVSVVVCVTPNNIVHVMFFTARPLLSGSTLTYSPCKWTSTYDERMNFTFLNLSPLPTAPTFFDCSIHASATSILAYVEKQGAVEDGNLRSRNLVRVLTWFIGKYLGGGKGCLVVSECPNNFHALQPFPHNPQANDVLEHAPFIIRATVAAIRTLSVDEQSFIAFSIHKCLVAALPLIEPAALTPFIYVFIWLQRVILSFPNAGLASENVLYIASGMRPVIRALLPEAWDEEWAAILQHTHTVVNCARAFISQTVF